MTVFIGIAAMCTGVLGTMAIWAATGIPSWAVALIAGVISGAMTWLILRGIRKEKEKQFAELDELHGLATDELWKMMDGIIKTKEEAILAAARDLKSVDVECQCCINAFDNSGPAFDECMEQENCEKCPLDCPCKGCKNRSNYQWRGICEKKEEGK